MNKLNLPLKLGFTLVFVFIIIALLAPWISFQDPQNMDLSLRYLTPSTQFWFGTDQNGSDIYSKIIYGSRVSFIVAISVVGLCTLIGLLVGSLAGYCGGTIDLIIMRFIDMIYSFPGFLLILSVASLLQSQSVWQLVAAMSLTGWASYARLVRGEVLHLKEKPYVQSAKSTGCSHFRILFNYIWPNLLGALIVQASFGMAVTILTESSLSFLGIGVPPHVPSWGALLNSGRDYLIEAPHISFFPGLAILLLVMGFNLMGDGLRDILDPRKR